MQRLIAELWEKKRKTILGDRQRRRSHLPLRPHRRDDAPPGTARTEYHWPAAPARSAQRRISRLSERALRPARSRDAGVRQKSARASTNNRRRKAHVTAKQPSRRQCLAVAGAGALTLGFGSARSAAAAATIRQGYQTNIWGMPTYYLMKSGYLEKHGLTVEDFAVPSGNITMQQMVARQVDLGNYAGPSFIIGNEEGELCRDRHDRACRARRHASSRARI